MKIIFAQGFKKSFDKYFSRNPIYSIPRFFNDTRYAIKFAYQRVVRGYDDSMIWDYHSHMTDMTIKILTTLRDRLHGYPSSLQNEKEWYKILTKIVKGFKAIEAIDECKFMRPTKKVYKTGVFKGLTRDRLDKQMLARLEKQRDEGFKLYVKYYSNLWD